MSGEMRREPRVFMLDLLATVPYYTAYLSRALLALSVPVEIGSITYYLDRECFRARGLRLRPGALDIVGRLDLPRMPRRILKLLETVVNHAAHTVRFAVRPPEILHVQFLPLLRSRLPLDCWFAAAMRRRGAKVVLTVHDLLPHDTAERFRILYTRLYGGVDALICHSSHIRQRLVDEFGVPADRIAVIPHGPFFFDLPGGDEAHTREAFGVPPGARMVLWQGIIFPYKGLDLLLEAWARAEQDDPEAVLVAVGTGAPDLVAALEAQAERLRLRNVRLHVRFVSPQELVALYRAADVVVYPYRAITTSGALATGLALGKAIIASDLPVFREQLTDGVDALLVDATDPAALAGALLRLLQEDGLRERLAAQVAGKDFGAASWDSIARQTEAVYQQVLQGLPAGCP